MPIITVEGPKIKDLERKRQLVKRVTDAAVEAYDIEDIIVLIKENAPENVGINGRLKADRSKDNA